MKDGVTIDTLLLRVAQTAKDLGAAEEREAILRILREHKTLIPGGNRLIDRLIAKIDNRSIVAEITDVPA